MTGHVAGCRCHDCYLMRSEAAAERAVAPATRIAFAVPSLPACDCGRPATEGSADFGYCCGPCMELDRAEAALRSRDPEAWADL